MSSAQQKVQQHPAFQQAQAKAHYYLVQLDKEVCSVFLFRVFLVVLKVPDDAAQLSKYPVLVSLEQRAQLPKAYAFIGAVALLTLLHFVNTLAAPVSNLIGWGLPAYLSFKALESPGNDDDAQWLTYWIIFGFFNFAEGFALRALLYYFPWYFSFKTLFILWLQLPAFRVSIPHYPIFYIHLSHLLGCANGLLQCTAARPLTTPYRPFPQFF